MNPTERDAMPSRGASKMNAPETEVAESPKLTKGWRFYAGMTALALALILPLGALFVPLLGLPAAQSVVLAGALAAGGPEVLTLLAVALLGKEVFQYFTHRAKGLLRRVLFETPVSKTRYYVGLWIILLSWLPAYLYAYLPTTMPGEGIRIYVLAAMDLAFVASVFLMGGEFWEKVRRIFIYEGNTT
jgi:hypothetical protein